MGNQRLATRFMVNASAGTLSASQRAPRVDDLIDGDGEH
jgi:hypothetical protein